MNSKPAQPALSLRQWIARPMKQWPAAQACVRTIYALLRLVTPTRSNQIVLESLPDCSDSAFALFEKMFQSKNAGNFKFIWLVKDAKASTEGLQREYPKLPNWQVQIVSKGSLRGFLAFMRSRYVFYTHNCYWFARSSFHQVVVYMGHGMPIKRMGDTEANSGIRIRSKHYTLATSRFFVDIIAGCYLARKERVLVAGLPRNEWLFQSEPKIDAVRNGRSRFVVWLPTFRESFRETLELDAAASAADPLAEQTLNALDTMLDDADVQLVIKLHPLDIKNRYAWPAYRNIRIYPDANFRQEGFNLYKLLSHADALVTDFSSIAIDYLLLNRPLGIFAPDMSEYMRGFMPTVLEKTLSISYRLNSVAELAEFVRHAAAGRPDAPELNDLYQQDLTMPSKSILLAVGLSELAG